MVKRKEAPKREKKPALKKLRRLTLKQAKKLSFLSRKRCFSPRTALRLACSRASFSELKAKVDFLLGIKLDAKIHGGKKLTQEELETLAQSPLSGIKERLLPWLKKELANEYALKWLVEELGWSRKRIEDSRFAPPTLKKRAELLMAEKITPNFKDIKALREGRLAEGVKAVAEKKERQAREETERSGRAAKARKAFERAKVELPPEMIPCLSYPKTARELEYLKRKKISLRALAEEGLLGAFMRSEKVFRRVIDGLAKRGAGRANELALKTRQAIIHDLKQTDKSAVEIARQRGVHFNTVKRFKRREGIFRPAEMKMIKPKANKLMSSRFPSHITQSLVFEFLAKTAKLPRKDLAFLFAAFPFIELDAKIDLLKESGLIIYAGSAEKAFKAYRKLLRLPKERIQSYYLPQLTRKFKALKEKEK